MYVYTALSASFNVNMSLIGKMYFYKFQEITCHHKKFISGKKSETVLFPELVRSLCSLKVLTRRFIKGLSDQMDTSSKVELNDLIFHQKLS